MLPSLANAELPSWFYLLYGSSRLVPLVKAEAREPGGDPDARPVAVGEVGLCAITRTVYAEAASVLADYLAPHQVAVGVPGGLDILVHGVRAFLRAQPEHVVVRFDLRNAYNEIDRCVALRRLAAVPELAHQGWAPTRAAVRGYTPSRARWRRRGRAPSGGGWARGASTRR